MVEALSLLNCFWRRVTLRDTLKKSSASQVQASHLEIKISLAGCLGRQRDVPREELCPLDPCNRTQDLEKRWSVLITSFASWDEIAEEVWSHVGREKEIGC